jgi:type IV pilus assembly protein PilA
MLKKLTKKDDGFTIIEVMIVLAIAGLILLIVFLAIPALQRNSRNTQRKNDVAAILAAIGEYTNNNNGALPNGATAWTNTNGSVTLAGAAGATTTQARVGFYDAGIGATNGQVNHAAAGATVIAGTLDTATEDYVQIATGTQCNGTASVAGPTRSVTAVYEIENGGGTFAQQCQQS